MSQQLRTAINAISKVKRYYRELSPVSFLDAFFQGIISDAEYTAIKSEQESAYLNMLINA